MTCIIAYKSDNKVYIGGDSIAATSSMKFTSVRSKVFSKNEIIFGSTTSFRMIQLLEFQVEFDDYETFAIDNDDLCISNWLITHVVENIRTTYKQFGYSTIESNVESGGDTIIAFRDKIFRLCADYSLIEVDEVCMSVGYGNEYALGACLSFDQTQKQTGFSPTQIVQKSLELTTVFCTYVQGPFHILNT